MNKTILTLVILSIIIFGILNVQTVSSETYEESNLIWKIETVESGESDGYVGCNYCMIINDQDYPIICYNDDSNYEIKLAVRNGCSWEKESVDIFEEYGNPRLLTFDENKNLCTYYTTDGTIKCAKKIGSLWRIEDLDENNELNFGLDEDISYVSIALDTLGNVHVCYILHLKAYTYLINYAKWNGNNWKIEFIDVVDDGRQTGIAIDRNNKPHISYFEGHENYDYIIYANNVSGNWQKFIVDTVDRMGEEIRLILDSMDKPHLVYQYRRYVNLHHYGGNSIKYAKMIGDSWINQTVEDGEPYIGIHGLSFALDSNDQPHLNYVIWESIYVDQYIRYIKWTGENWCKGIIEDLSFIVSVELVLDRNNEPHMCFYDDTDDFYLKYAKGIIPYVPETPQNLQISEGDCCLELSWDAPTEDDDLPITHYILYKGINPEENTQLTTIDYFETLYKDLNVTNGQTYYYNITAVNAYGESESTQEISGMPKGVPTQPLNLQATEEIGQVTLKWQEPINNGGLFINQYKIYRGESKENINYLTTVKGDKQNYTDKNLDSDVTYFYKISAVNELGESEKSVELSASPKKAKTDGGTEEKSPFLEPWFLIVILFLIIIIVFIVIFSVMRKRKSATIAPNPPAQLQIGSPSQPPPLQPGQVQNQHGQQPPFQPQQITQPTLTPQDSNLPPSSASTQLLMTRCPLCNQQIPEYTNPCPHCDSELEWEENC